MDCLTVVVVVLSLLCVFLCLLRRDEEVSDASFHDIFADFCGTDEEAVALEWPLALRRRKTCWACGFTDVVGS